MRKILKYVAIALALLIVIGAGVLWVMSRPDIARFSDAELSGRVPVMASQKPEILPTVNIPEVTGWPAGTAPVAAPGLAVTRFAEGLDHPRSMLVLPNGDVLVAETNRPPTEMKGVTGMVMKRLFAKAGAAGPSANRITLLRDADGDGRAEVKVPYLTGLNSPYGMELVGDTLYVANTDALMAFPYAAGATRITAPGRKIADLPARYSNSHWTKSLVALPDGKRLLVGVGANSNIAEGGLDKEIGRAAVLEINVETGQRRIFTAGLRNPVGIALHPVTRDVWTVVNERDMIGSDLVPDYLTRIDFGQFYGWPWYYWGGFIDNRVEVPDVDQRRQYTRRPDYALGAHVAPLGMDFSDGQRLGAPFGNGAFIALHGSWNRVPASGYSVVFVAFDNLGRPADALPLPVLQGFLTADAKTARGRPADAKIAGDGSLLVADDTGNIIWRVSAAGGTPAGGVAARAR